MGFTLMAFSIQRAAQGSSCARCSSVSEYFIRRSSIHHAANFFRAIFPLDNYLVISDGQRNISVLLVDECRPALNAQARFGHSHVEPFADLQDFGCAPVFERKGMAMPSDLTVRYGRVFT